MSVVLAGRKRLLSLVQRQGCAPGAACAAPENEYDIVGLVTTVNENFARVAMHGVREELLQAQAGAAGLPLWRVPLPHPLP